MNGQAEQTGRILVIDDNRAIHEDIRKVLSVDDEGDAALDVMEADLFGEALSKRSRRGFEIDSAYQGQEGLQLVARSLREQRPYSVAFVDVRMPPGWDGIETISHLWKEDPDLQMVICTAYSDHSWEDIVKTLGQSDRLLILKKPFDNVELLQTTHALSHKWWLHQQLQQRLRDLESLVEDRTQDLRQANQNLQAEIEERRKAEDELKHLATHDLLTDLPNRLLLHDRLEHVMARARRYRNHVALLLVDLDNFKEVNDTLGHKTGDKLLKVAADRLKRAIRQCDTVARLGGDEFVVVLDDLAEAKMASVAAGRILKAFGESFEVDGQVIRTTASIGICIYPNDCDNVEGLLKGADMAMYRIKQERKNGFCFYSPAMSSRAQEVVELREALHNAVEQEQFEVYYQPLNDIESGDVAGMEALIRWNHPQQGVISPMHFIPAAEDTGLIVPIGRWVLETACRQNMAWQQAGFPPIPIAVNVSERQLSDGALVGTVEEVLQATGLEPRYLELELTESAAMKNPERSLSVLGALYDLGVRIMIDDFGAGYSSLSRLKSLPIHGLKIDRFFVQHVVDDERDAAIVAAVVALARSLRIEMVAEGVETAEQLRFLRSIRKGHSDKPRRDRAQGYLFSRPVPAAQATELLRTRRG